MDWSQVLTILVSTIGMFFWARMEAREDRKENSQILRAIQEEMKDFHGRLCAIEAARK